MSNEALIQLVSNSIRLTLFVVAPLLATALTVGLTISIVQVVTSIQDMTLSFVPRIVAVFVVGLILLPWIIERVTIFTTNLIRQFPLLAQ
jgi:flagellar biosynthetic protein FliQ